MAATLLLADESVTIQRVIELTFANEGVRVLTAGDGHEATARLEDARPDIVLADVGLPGVDGYALAERVKRSSALATVPVLLLTGAFEPIDEARARACGADGVLVKPFDSKRMVTMVTGLLAGQRPANLWPTDMPRIEPPASALVSVPPAVALERPAPPIQAPVERRRSPVSEPESLLPVSAMEEVFEIGLDDLDLAFSRLDPVAPAGRLDADTVLDFRRDIQELRSTPAEDASLAAATAARAPERERPIQDMTPVDREGLDWDLPAPRVAREPEPVAPPPPPSPVEPPVFISEAAVEEVVRRVVTRITDEVVRKVVMETADRLIREEIDRLKQ